MRILYFLSTLLLSTLPLAAPAAVTYVGSIDLEGVVPRANGVVPLHIALQQTALAPVLYVTTSNYSAATKLSIPALKIVDPVGNPQITQFDLNTGDGGVGVPGWHGYGGVAVLGDDVYLGWYGNTDATTRLRRYDATGALTGDWTTAAMGSGQRVVCVAAGTGASNANPHLIVGRFSSTGNFMFCDLTSPYALTRHFPIHDYPSHPGVPGDIVYHPGSKAIYTNLMGAINRLSPEIPGDITTPAAYEAATSSYTSIVYEGQTNQIGQGIALSPDGNVLGYVPNQRPGGGLHTVRLATPTGTTLEVIGTLESRGDGTDGKLNRPGDVAMGRIQGQNYVFVTDFDADWANPSTPNRIAIYTTTTDLPAAVTSFSVD